MNSLNESSCWRTKPFSSKNDEITTHASSCATEEKNKCQSREFHAIYPSFSCLATRAYREHHPCEVGETPHITCAPMRARYRDGARRVVVIVVFPPDTMAIYRRTCPISSSSSSSRASMCASSTSSYTPMMTVHRVRAGVRVRDARVRVNEDVDHDFGTFGATTLCEP